MRRALLTIVPLAAAATVLFAVAATVLPATAAARTVTVSGGAVTASLTYTKRGLFEFRGVALRITRAGVIVQDGPIAPPCPGCPVAPADRALPESALQVVDLDGDGDPEVIVGLYTGGAHCCSQVLIYGFDAATGTYVRAFQDFGNVGYTLKDLTGDGVPELDSLDDRFAYAFVPYAGSAFPVRVFRYEGKRLADVTRTLPALVSGDAARWKRAYQRIRRRDGLAARARMAAYVADLCLLGRCGEGLKAASAAVRRGEFRSYARSWPAGRKYLRELRRLLRRYGYLARPARSG